MKAIEVKNITKKFNSFTAVDAVSFNIKKGELFGLLGPNGAGKTTTINILSTILKPTSGTAKINGFGLEDQDDVRKSIGIVFQDPSLDDELTGRENLDFHGRMYHMHGSLREKRIKEVLKLIGLEDKADMQVKTYSGGMKRRLEIARGLIHYPKVLFLDEPTIGLDPQTRRSIWKHIEKLNREQKITIILTTHYMEEADYLCDKVAIIDHGKIIAIDTQKNLKDVMGGDIITLESNNIEKLKNILKHKWVKKMDVFDNKINITVKNGENVIPKIIDAARRKKIKINSVNLKKPTLEDVFIHYTGRSIREETGSSKDRMRVFARARGMR